MKTLFLVMICCAVAAHFAARATANEPKRPMKIDDLFRFKRLADPQVSPDGKWVVYQVGVVDYDANKSSTSLWLVPADGSAAPKQLTNPNGKSDRHPRWSPDGKKIAFESTRSGTVQLWSIAIDGGEAAKLTDLPTGVESAIWSPDGTHLAFVSVVYPEFSTLSPEESAKKNKEKLEAVENNPVKAKVFSRLFFRHWDEYVEDKRRHLFVCKADGSGVRDVTPGDRDADPTSKTFSSGDDFTFTPDSKHLVFTAVPVDGEAWSTNYDLCRVTIDNSSTKWETLTSTNKAADSGPRFSPNGKRLTWRAQKQAGYEADRWEALVVACDPDGSFKEKPENWSDSGILLGLPNKDVSVSDLGWYNDDVLLCTAELRAEQKLYAIAPSKETFPESLKTLISKQPFGTNNSTMSCGGTVVFANIEMTRPAEIFAARSDGTPSNVTKANDSLLDEFERPRPESIDVPVEGDVKMQMWILKPPGFDASKKWPVAYLVHGGPQGAWEDGWSYRWNPQLWAAQGYVVVMPNPRGSTGFGQKFVDEISGDWGGKCYRDLVAGLDAVEKLPYVDKDRMAAAGASFGGYMMNWFAVNEISKRFQCLITHCSVWNFESMWGTTDELWFDEWEHQGLPWEKPGKYGEFSPHRRAGEMGKVKTPMLIIHNDLDFRCPIGQGHELFAALQRQKVPSRFINFPDECHWVLKPKNSKFWHTEVFDWLTKFAPPGGK